MDVNLYVYDLSKGLARMYSLPLTGTHIDAIYHTSIVVDGIEYYFGQGIQTAAPGSTHHGHPMEVVPLGRTGLPKEVIEEYLESLGDVYSPESYDLFLHNCNNFTQDLATFLVGKSIPDHIRNLPQTFLSTPFGQMLKPQIENSLRGVTQGTGTAGVPQPAAAAAAPTPGLTAPPPGATAAAVPHGADAGLGTVQIVNNLQQLEAHLTTASQTNKAAVIFFTSATCPPCKMVYPMYDELAEEAGNRAILIRVDISSALSVSMKYGVRATPTFMMFLNGEKVDEWSGANPGQLRSNVRLLVSMQVDQNAHPHDRLDVPSLQREITQFVAYRKVPPLDKVKTKLVNCDKQVVSSIITFIQARNASKTPADVPIPDNLPAIAAFLQTAPRSVPRDNHFAIVDLARLLILDPRVSGYFAERDPAHQTLVSLLSLASSPDSPQDSIPYSLRMTLLQLTCNLFTNPLYTIHLANCSSTLRTPLLHLATSSLLPDPDAHIPPPTRITATSVIYNFAALTHDTRLRAQGKHVDDPLTTEEQVELTAAIIEALSMETQSAEAVRGLVLALGLLVFRADVGGEVVDVCRAMGARDVLTKNKKTFQGQKEAGVIAEVVRLLD